MKGEIQVRSAKPEEFESIGKMMVEVYSQLDGFPKPHEMPHYYDMLKNVGELTKKPGTELVVATSQANEIKG
ncbi:MAG TPA: hypothetical protein VG737_12595, partial [Cyclobacteriaceae bacterium]|nr:hypothetical protein [Cyclobacteriaceae bacterium]